MEEILKYLRLRIAAVTALVAAGLVLMAMSASANAALSKNISVGIVNNSNTPITVHYCAGPDVSLSYRFLLSKNPCYGVTHTAIIGANGHRHTVSNTNPLGMIVTAKGKTLYFYARNPTVGLPYFDANGSGIALREFEEVFRTVDGVHVGFLRYEDDVRNGEIVKVMRIELVNWK